MTPTWDLLRQRQLWTKTSVPAPHALNKPAHSGFSAALRANSRTCVSHCARGSVCPMVLSVQKGLRGLPGMECSGHSSLPLSGVADSPFPGGMCFAKLRPSHSSVWLQPTVCVSQRSERHWTDHLPTCSAARVGNRTEIKAIQRKPNGSTARQPGEAGRQYHTEQHPKTMPHDLNPKIVSQK